jgi:hypothetical protein
MPDDGLYAGVDASSNGLASANLVELADPAKARIDLTFKPASTLADGVYTDTVTVHVCYDAYCRNYVRNSPLTLNLTYTVTREVQPEPGLTPLSVATRSALAHNVIDAEASRALDAVVMVGSWPSPALYVYDLASATERQLPLPKAPTAVSVSPDGLYAAVGHDALITHVDLRSVGSGNVTKALNVSARVHDLVLGGNGYVYAFPAVDQWVAVHSIEIATNTESTPYSVIYAGANARLHPSGTALYAADNGLSPSDIQKYDLSAGVAAALYDSPYHGDYAMCGDLWFKDDGSQIYTACGNTFRSSSERTQDMVYAGALSLPTDSSYSYRILSLSQSSTAKEIAVVEQTWYECSVSSDLSGCKSHVVLFESDFLVLKARYSLAPLAVSGSSYAQRGLFVFHRAGASAKVLISRLDGMPNAAAEYYLSTFD